MSPQERIHRRAMVALGIFVGIVLVVTAIAQLTGMGLRFSPVAEPVAMVQLRFEDGPEGLVTVTNAETDEVLAEYGMDEGVFVRSVMRGIARQRRLRNQEGREPVVLAEYPDGKLWLLDPTNEVEIYLGAFGPDNRAAWANLLYGDEALATAELAGAPQ